jgi:hypothetical protein
MRHPALKPLLGIAVVFSTIAGATNAAFANSSSPDLSHSSETLSSIALSSIATSSITENSPPQAQSSFQVAQFSLFPWNTGLRDRQNQASREVQRCLDKRSRRDRENCLTNLRNTRHDRQNHDRQNHDRRNDRSILSREEKRCLEKRSYRDRENCLINLRNTRRYDRQNYDRRFPSQPYPGTYRR